MHATEIPWALADAPADDGPDDLVEWATEIGLDAATYRDLLCEALAVLADVTRDRDRLRDRYRAVLDERRAAS